MERSESVKELTAALVRVQGQLRPAAKDSENPHFRSRYADLASIWEVCREPLADHGLAVIQTPELLPDGLGVGLRTTLFHASGEFVSGVIPLCYQAGNMQSLGSAVTYARRYGLAAMVGIVAEDDDDGHLAAKLMPAAALPAPPPRDHAPPSSPRPDPGPDRGTWPGTPSSGKALFAWVKAMEQKHEVGVLKHLNEWARRQGFAGKMVDWGDDQVALAHAEAMRTLDQHAGGREPGSDDY